MKKLLLFSWLFIFVKTASNGQNQLPIATDRPDQTECPFIVPKGYFQIESGFFYEKTNKISHSMAYPSVLWKYGLSENMELRLITELVSERSNTEKNRGIAPMTVGFKVKILEEKGLLPKTSFIGHLTIPKMASKELSVNYVAPSFRFTMQHTLSDRFTLAYNLGAEWDGESPKALFLYTLTSGFAITKKLGSYVEIYGFASQNQPIDHRLDGGFTYLINDNVMIDVSSGLGLTSNAPHNFISLGLSIRFDSKWQK